MRQQGDHWEKRNQKQELKGVKFIQNRMEMANHFIKALANLVGQCHAFQKQVFDVQVTKRPTNTVHRPSTLDPAPPRLDPRPTTHSPFLNLNPSTHPPS